MVEGNGLENRHTGKPYREFESHPHRSLWSSLYLVMDKLRAILIPGNGGGSPHDNWFHVERELTGARYYRDQCPVFPMQS